MQQLDYGAFTERIRAAGSTSGNPLAVSVEVTGRCPMRCLHCYNREPRSEAENRRAPLQLSEHRRLVDELAELGCLWLLYTGGEIFSRPDFMDIYRHASDSGLLVTLFTSAVLVDARIADQLAERRPLQIEISLYGATPQTHDRVTGVEGAYVAARRGIDLLLERGLPVALKTMVLQANRHELDQMVDLARHQLQVPFRYDAQLNPRIDGDLAPLAQRLDHREVLELDQADPQRQEAWQSFAESYCQPDTDTDAGEPASLYQCGAGVSSFSVDPWGGLSMCALSDQPVYDWRTGRLDEGWQILQKLRRQRVEHSTDCDRCQLRPLCGMCPAVAQLEHGDPRQPVEFLCRLAQNRARSLELNVAGDASFAYIEGEGRT